MKMKVCGFTCNNEAAIILDFFTSGFVVFDFNLKHNVFLLAVIVTGILHVFQ